MECFEPILDIVDNPDKCKEFDDMVSRIQALIALTTCSTKLLNIAAIAHVVYDNYIKSKIDPNGAFLLKIDGNEMEVILKYVQKGDQLAVSFVKFIHMMSFH